MPSQLSLRNRFIIGFVVIATLLALGSSFAARQIMVASLQAGLDSAMERRAEFVRNEVLVRSPEAGGQYEIDVDRLSEDELPDIPRLLRIADSNGFILTSFGTVPEITLAELDNELYAAGQQGEHFESVRIRNTRALRVYTLPLTNPDTGETIGIIQTANSLAPIESAQTQLWLATAGIAIGGAALAGLAGFFLVKLSFVPLDHILSRVSEVEAGEPALRLPEEQRPPELQALADSLNDMWDRLRGAVAARDEFIASVSHDLRTPLTAIRGQVDVMLLDPGLGGEDRRSLERMQREIVRLVRLSNNLLLDVQLDRAPKVSNEQVNLRELVEDVVLEMQHMATDRELRIHAQHDVIVLGDYDLLKQAVINLVDNAIKFTPAGGRIDAHVVLDGAEGIVRIEDTGPGINPVIAESLEAPFKASTTRSAANGAGLGLSIVSKVTRSHGGTVRIGTRKNGHSGACVEMRLPLHGAIVSVPAAS